ncbi:MAG TPA: class I SAM-dependent methyltransferase [Methylomirabilota bacterium]|jgi:tellurite methyltransferase|nr:class I SAM-dependent methyltransferase [Methylomirabilota bacterium]
MTRSPWAREYVRRPHEYIWGTKPSEFARGLGRLLPARARVLDLGCGEGRDSVYFATQGCDVSGVEISRAGLHKAERLARERGVQVLWIQADMPRLVPRGPFDLVYSCGAIHYVPRRHRVRWLRRLQAVTRPGGYHGFVVFTNRQIHEEKGEIVDYFTPGELARAYPDWRILRCQEGEISCAQDGVPHRHSVESFVARRC